MEKKHTPNCGTCKFYVEKALLIRNNYFEGYCKENTIFTTSDLWCDYYKKKKKPKQLRNNGKETHKERP